MTSLIIGEFILFDPECVAIHDRQENVFRYYMKYCLYVPMDTVAIDIGSSFSNGSDVHDDEDRILADIWVPVHSPDNSFPDKSLVYLCG